MNGKRLTDFDMLSNDVNRDKSAILISRTFIRKPGDLEIAELEGVSYQWSI